MLYGLFARLSGANSDGLFHGKDKDFSVYEVPLSLVDHGLDELIVRKMNLSNTGKPDLERWRELIHRLRNPQYELSIAVVGKYAKLRDAYKSIFGEFDPQNLNR